MKISHTLWAGLAAASLAATPALAETNRASAPTEDASEMGGSGAWIAIAGVILVVALAALAAFDDDDDIPISA